MDPYAPSLFFGEESEDEVLQLEWCDGYRILHDGDGSMHDIDVPVHVDARMCRYDGDARTAV